MGLCTFLLFLLGALGSSSTAAWGNAPFETPPDLSRNVFVPTPFLWLSLSSPYLGDLTQLLCWIFNLLCAIHFLLKHSKQRGRGKSFLLLKSQSVKNFFIAACQERKYNSKETAHVSEWISLSPIQQLCRAGARGCCSGEDNPVWHGAAWNFTVSISLDTSLEYTVNSAWPLWTDK